MKKILIIFSFILTTPFLFGQYINGIHLSEINAEYIHVQFTYRSLKRTPIALVDYGQEVKGIGFSKANVLRDEYDGDIIFNSTMDGINFFYRNGHELFQAVNKQTSEDSSYTFYILKRIR